MKHFFESYILVQQDIITSKEATEKFLSLPGITEIRSELEKVFCSEISSASHKWIKLSEVLDKRNCKQVIKELSSFFNIFKKLDILNQVIMHYMLPRIDSHVSIQLNHLLKLPFCIHPDSGKFIF